VVDDKGNDFFGEFRGVAPPGPVLQIGAHP